MNINKPTHELLKEFINSLNIDELKVLESSIAELFNNFEAIKNELKLDEKSK